MPGEPSGRARNRYSIRIVRTPKAEPCWGKTGEMMRNGKAERKCIEDPKKLNGEMWKKEEERRKKTEEGRMKKERKLEKQERSKKK